MSTSVLAWRANNTKCVGLARHFLVLGQRLFVWIVRPSRTRSSTPAPNIAAALHWQEFCGIIGAKRMKDTAFEMDPRIPYGCFFAFADVGARVWRGFLRQVARDRRKSRAFSRNRVLQCSLCLSTRYGMRQLTGTFPR